MLTVIMIGTVLTITGMEMGLRYSVQTSTDLREWSTAWQETGTGQARCFMVDSSALSRFFRVVTIPRFRATRPPEPRGL